EICIKQVNASLFGCKVPFEFSQVHWGCPLGAMGSLEVITASKDAKPMNAQRLALVSFPVLDEQPVNELAGGHGHGLKLVQENMLQALKPLDVDPVQVAGLFSTEDSVQATQ